ncbi:hypothetical protein JCM8097_004475 [Rhodosporidiobolus ruineniae]
MSTEAPIICGVTCACASKPDPATSSYSAPAVPLSLSPNKNTAASGCSARESCKYSQEGLCACGKEGGGCKASQAKRGCERAVKGECSCAAGTCQAAESARAACDKKGRGECGCAPGQCAQAGYTA